MPLRRFLRYLAPNVVTSMGMLFGMLSLVASYEHRFVDAAWLIIWAVLLDRLDGLVARSLKATSDFGVQMDSFADAFNFGIAPAFLVYVTLAEQSAIGFSQGWGRAVLMAACGLWALANVFRLAKFNVVVETPTTGPKVFFGVPTTLAAGLLVIWYLVLAKYAPAQGPIHAEPFGGPKLFGDWAFPISVWSYVPATMIAFAFLMASNVPIPKLQGLGGRGFMVVLLLGVFSGYACGFARMLPEYMALLPSSWLVGALVWSQLSSRARGMTPPPVLPDPGPLRGPASHTRE